MSSYDIPQGANMCPPSASVRCDERTRKVCSKFVASQLRLARDANEHNKQLEASIEDEIEANRTKAAEQALGIEDPEDRSFFENLNIVGEAAVRSIMPHTEIVVRCSGPIQRNWLGPVCTANFVEIEKRH